MPQFASVPKRRRLGRTPLHRAWRRCGTARTAALSHYPPAPSLALDGAREGARFSQSAADSRPWSVPASRMARWPC